MSNRNQYILNSLSNRNQYILISLLKLKEMILNADEQVLFNGICYNMNLYYGIKSSEYKFLFELWNEYSGSSEYPVEHPTMSPVDGFDCTYDNMYIDEYGASRLRLLDFLIEQFQLKVAQ